MIQHRAELLLDERYELEEDLFVELVVWRVPSPVIGSSHRFKYRLALVANDECVLRYDNESGKGDHKHIGTVEQTYEFTDIRHLIADFRADVSRWRRK